MVAIQVVAVQAACLAAFAIGGLLPEPERLTQRDNGAGLQFASVIALLFAPVLMHERLSRSRWPPEASRQVTIIASLVGLVLGFVLGSLLVETLRLPDRGIGWRVGALLGSFTALFVTNLVGTRP